jgi:hypothetical protein
VIPPAEPSPGVFERLCIRSRRPEEQDWIDRIERLRAELNASEEQITRIDYGAGTPNSVQAPEQMHAGVEVMEPLEHISQVASKPLFWCFVLFKLLRVPQPRS